MTQEQIIDALRNTMKESSGLAADWDAITADTQIDALGFDSLAILDLIYDVQQHFDLDFDAEAIADVKSVGELATFLEAQGA